MARLANASLAEKRRLFRRRSRVVAAALATAGALALSACDPPPFFAPACTEKQPEAFASYVDASTVEIVVTAPFDADPTRGAFSTVEPDVVHGGTLLSQAHAHYLTIDVRPDEGASEISFRTSAICHLTGEDPGDGGRYPHFLVTVELPAMPAEGDPVRVSLTREAQT